MNPDQIAAEAAHKLTGDTEGAAYRAAFQTVKSAIEKALKDIIDQYNELKAVANARFCGHCDIGDSEAECTCGNYDLRPRAARAGEP